MPEGPLGFPRLTTLGPFVEESSIKPFKSFNEDTYRLSFIESNQGKTGQDTRRALRDILEFELEVIREMPPDEAEFAYRKAQLSDVLGINEFSSSLLEAMEIAESNGIPLRGDELTEMEIENEELEDELDSLFRGEPSIFSDSLIDKINFRWSRTKQGDLPPRTSKSEEKEEVIGSVIADFHRVTVINDKIRDSREYFPPTTEDLSLGGVLNWGTIDGAHRVVALSQILGADKEVFIWEWENQKEFMEQSRMF